MSKKKRAQETAGSSSARLYIVLGAVALIVVVAVGYSVMGPGGFSTATVTAPVEVEGLDDPSRLIEMAQGVSYGNDDAPITIVEFGDYQCPACGAFATQVKPRVDLAYLESGEANFVFYDFPLVSIHPNAFLAARAARCAGDQDAFWPYHSELFKFQASWSGSASPIGQFVDYAEGVGIDPGEFEACLKSDRHAEVVSANLRLGEELGVGGTPTIMVSTGDGAAQRLPAFDFLTIQQAVEQLKESDSN